METCQYLKNETLQRNLTSHSLPILVPAQLALVPFAFFPLLIFLSCAFPLQLCAFLSRQLQPTQIQTLSFKQFQKKFVTAKYLPPTSLAKTPRR